ncbi:MAG: Cell division protein ftsA, partial [Candidatus Curtissbacteria bacterium GW2011_GWA1_40_16]
KLEIQKSNFTGLTPSGVVLTGGGSLTVGITELAKQELSMPVRIGIPQNATGLVDEISSPEYATALGLVIYGTDYQQEDIRLPVVGRVEIKGIVSKGIGFIKSLLP